MTKRKNRRDWAVVVCGFWIILCLLLMNDTLKWHSKYNLSLLAYRKQEYYIKRYTYTLCIFMNICSYVCINDDIILNKLNPKDRRIDFNDNWQMANGKFFIIFGYYVSFQFFFLIAFIWYINHNHSGCFSHLVIRNKNKTKSFLNSDFC